MHIDFSSAIDNARFVAAREEALCRNAGPTVAVQRKSSQWSTLPKGGRPGARGRLSPSPVMKATPVAPVAHAH
jgi:hypothetical protein